jgi:hypothetical protein
MILQQREPRRPGPVVTWSILQVPRHGALRHTSTQCARRMAHSQRNRSTLHRLSFAWVPSGPAWSAPSLRTAGDISARSALDGGARAWRVQDDGGTDQPARANEQRGAATPRSGQRAHCAQDHVDRRTVMCRARLGGVLKFYYREARTRWTEFRTRGRLTMRGRGVYVAALISRLAQ